MSDLTRFADYCHQQATRDDQTASDVALWRRLAVEVDEYLQTDHDDTPLELPS